MQAAIGYLRLRRRRAWDDIDWNDKAIDEVTPAVSQPRRP
jgi:hypothetical protein